MQPPLVHQLNNVAAIAFNGGLIVGELLQRGGNENLDGHVFEMPKLENRNWNNRSAKPEFAATPNDLAY